MEEGKAPPLRSPGPLLSAQLAETNPWRPGQGLKRAPPQTRVPPHPCLSGRGTPPPASPPRPFGGPRRSPNLHLQRRHRRCHRLRHVPSSAEDRPHAGTPVGFRGGQSPTRPPVPTLGGPISP